MGIDLQYLLFLQNLRVATGGIFDEFFNSLSKFAVDIMPFVPLILFWGVNKKWGYRALATYLTGEILNGIIKLTVCAYRPWIRSDQIEPAGDSKVAATGYSFPSGHSLCASMLYGIIYVFQKNKRKWLATLCIILIVLTGFSRNFLGVHTPQDVIVGLLEGVFVIWIVGLVMKKTEGNEKMHDMMTIGGFVAIIAVILYIKLKSYPMDYVDGKLLVDPQAMMNDTFKACGMLFGFLVGSWIERHYLHYEIPTNSPNLPALTVVGFMIVFAWKEWFGPATIVAAFGSHWGNFIARALMYIFGMVIWPMFIKKECGKK